MPQENTAIAAILARYQHWMQSIRERDLEAILDIYADNATYMPPGKPAFSGKQALREVWAGYLQREDFVASYVPTLHLCDAGDMAYDIGRYRIAMKKEGLPVSFEGEYVVVWKRIDGRWKAVVDMDNDNGPAVQDAPTA